MGDMPKRDTTGDCFVFEFELINAPVNTGITSRPSRAEVLWRSGWAVFRVRSGLETALSRLFFSAWRLNNLIFYKRSVCR